MGVADDEFVNTLQSAELHLAMITLHGQRLLVFFYGRTAFGVFGYTRPAVQKTLLTPSLGHETHLIFSPPLAVIPRFPLLNQSNVEL
jgi:hypothetical protein